jgi:hypothetical protein
VSKAVLILQESGSSIIPELIVILLLVALLLLYEYLRFTRPDQQSRRALWMAILPLFLLFSIFTAVRLFNVFP